MNRLIRCAHHDKVFFYFCSLLILISFLPDSAQATHMVRSPGCSGDKGCHAILRLPDGTLQAIDLEGFGAGDTFVDVGVNAESFTWRTTDFAGHNPLLGTLAVHLNPTMTSIGIVESLSPTATPPFPASQTNFFFFNFSAPDLGLTTFNKVPFTVHTPFIDNVPPTFAIYTLQQPVDFFDVTNPLGPPAFTIVSAEVTFAAVPEPTTLLLLSTGVAGVAIKTRKRFRMRKSGQSRY